MEVQSDLTGEARIPEDQLLCKITDDLKDDEEHERNRQQVAEELHGEYGYTYDQMAVEYTLKAGSESRDADIVVFEKSGTRRQEDIRIAIEIEPEDTEPDEPNHGIEQAKSYMRLAPCEFGIWFNGVEHFYFHQEDDGSFTEIKDVPPHGSTLKDIEKRTFDQLTPAVELKTEFKRCHNYIAANQGLSKTDAFYELIKVIFCKAHDERHSTRVRFYVTDEERRNNPEACKRRIESLFDEVKDAHSIFDEDDGLKFDADVLSYVVAELEPYLLLDTDSDVKGDAYETIVGSNLRGDRGEFFTPRNVCQAGVAMAFHTFPERDWSSQDIIDPACGTGGFLISVIEFLKQNFIAEQEKKWKDPKKAREVALDLIQEYCENHLYGMDLSPQLIRAAQMNEVMHGNGHRNPFSANSLDYPDSWSDDSVKLGMFDMLFTNPPFGASLKVEDKEILRQYDLGHQWEGTTMKSGLRKSVPPQQLFIERSLQLLKSGGRASIVTPDSILTNPSEEFIRHWILKNAKVLASVGLPRETFEPYTPTKTHLVLFEKRASPIDNPAQSNHKTFMAAAEKMGNDKRGEPIYLRTPEGEKIVDGSGEPIIDDDLPAIVEAFKDWNQ